MSEKKKKSSLRKLAILVVLVEIAVIVICNLLMLRSDSSSDNSKIYRVEAKHVAEDLEKILAKVQDTTVQDATADNSKSQTEGVSTDKTTDANLQAAIEQLDLTAYPTIQAIAPFHPNDIADYDYLIEEVGGSLIRIEYAAPKESLPIVYMNIGFGLICVVTLILFIYVDRRISRPFVRMSDYADELAKGNLITPIDQQKSRHFGRFIWGMDRLREQLEADREREHEYMKERKTLLLSLSHDIKTPLAAIELYNKALSTGLYDTEEKRRSAYDGIEKNIGDLRRYIDEITTASRQDFISLTVRDGEFYLDEVMEQIETYYMERFVTLHTQFEISNHGNPLLKGDEDRVVEVFQNILENAIKYGDGRRVWVDFSTEEDAELIHVHNSGDPLPDGEEVHVFDSFYRGSNAEGKKGSGLGLYISRELMRRMDGEIYIESGEGFTAVVVLRRA